jgi:hypothetical protein
MSQRVPPVEPVYLPEGVADPAGATGHLPDPPGIVAVALGDGRLLWRSEAARTALLSDGERLFAARPRPPNALEVVVLDARRGGEPVLISDPVALPTWASEPSRMRAQADGPRLRLEWEASARYAGGAPPPPHILRQAIHDVVGAALVDLESGAVSPLAVETRPPAIRRPPLDPEDAGEPWLAGATVVRLVWEIDGDRQTVSLERAEPLEATRLAQGRGLVAHVTPDGRHVFVRAEPPPAEGDAWSIFAVPSGRRVATVTHDRDARSPAIVGDRAYYLVESAARRALRARDVATDALVWEFPLVARPARAAPRPRQ